MTNVAHIRVGDMVPSITVDVSPALLAGFKVLANDQNASHYDAAAARAQGFRTAVAHGAIGASFLLRMLTQWQVRPLSWDDEVEISFVAPVVDGHRVTACGEVRQVGAGYVVCDIWCESAKGNKLIIGKARLTLPL